MAKTKGDGIPIPDVLDPPDSMRMTLCIPKNRDHMAAFFGALYQLTVWQSWQEDDAHSGAILARVWWRYFQSWNRTMNDIDCEDGMSQCCVEPSITKRINPDTGQTEQSTDNGATWSPASGGLPQYIVQPPPPITSGVSATKCDAATNVRSQVSEWVDKVGVDFDTATSLVDFSIVVFEAILIAVVTFLTAGTLTAAQAAVLPTIGAALHAAWTAGKTVFVSYWVAEKLDIVLCAAYNHIAEDGSFNDSQFGAFWAECNGLLPPSPAKMLFMGFLSSVGATGVSSMAATGKNADSDCGKCVDTCATRYDVICDIGHDVTRNTDDGWMTVKPNFTGWTGELSVCISTGDIMKGCFIDHVEINGIARSMNSGARWIGEEIWPCEGSIGHVTTNVPCNTPANTWLLWGSLSSTEDVVKIFFSEEACEE